MSSAIDLKSNTVDCNWLAALLRNLDSCAGGSSYRGQVVRPFRKRNVFFYLGQLGQVGHLGHVRRLGAHRERAAAAAHTLVVNSKNVLCN